MKLIYRDVEYDIQSTNGNEWTYNAYPKKAKVNGSPLHGAVTGTEADAVKACKDAIDEAYQ